MLPALKGDEGCGARYETGSKEGCTFWKNGLCELHTNGLKPIQGKLARHDLSWDQNEEISALITDAWEDNKGESVIEKWKKLVNYNDDEH